MEVNSQLPIKITLAILIIMHLLTGVVSKVKCYIKTNKKVPYEYLRTTGKPKGAIFGLVAEGFFHFSRRNYKESCN